jgi:16S rRNA (guanine966-N2)-methyltransferase
MITYELKVLSGSLKNRSIPFFSNEKKHSNCTPSKIKEAVVSIIDSHLMKSDIKWSDIVFIDAFAGSGQMGIELVSRGCELVHFIELDKDRFKSILEITQELKISQFSKLHNKDSIRCVKKIASETVNPLIIFIDPPYSFYDKTNKVEIFLKDLRTAVDHNSILIVQSPERLKIEMIVDKKFGNSYLSIIKKKE